MKTKPEPILLARTGDAPLRVTGELVAREDGKYAPGTDEPRTRYYRLSIYRHEGRYACAVELLTTWPGEPHWYAAEVTDDPAAFFRAHRDIPEGIGFPPRPELEQKQARLAADMRRQYDELVTEILDDEEFAATPDTEPPITVSRVNGAYQLSYRGVLATGYTLRLALQVLADKLERGQQ